MKLVERSVEGFLEELGSDSPAPGGGSAAALAGAMAASLCSMVCRLTLGRKKLEESWPEMRETLREAEESAGRLRRLVDEDSDAYNGVVAARRLPKETAGEIDARRIAVEEATLCSARVPLETLEALALLAPLLERAALRGNPACASDAATGAALLRAAASSAACNVRANLRDIGDGPLRAELAAATSAAIVSIEQSVGGVERAAEERLKG
jgi:formiminotetrahydrofolate cyclodeaminase